MVLVFQPHGDGFGAWNTFLAPQWVNVKLLPLFPCFWSVDAKPRPSFNSCAKQWQESIRQNTKSRSHEVTKSPSCCRNYFGFGSKIFLNSWRQGLFAFLSTCSGSRPPLWFWCLSAAEQQHHPQAGHVYYNTLSEVEGHFFKTCRLYRKRFLMCFMRAAGMNIRMKEELETEAG